jgi:hypothetical protein
MTTTLEIMHRMFREQHRQMIEEQKRLLEDYKQYFDGILQQMEEEQAKVVSLPSALPPEQEDMAKEITEIGILLDDAVKTYGKELAEIITQLTERQRKRTENSLKEMGEKIS